MTGVFANNLEIACKSSDGKSMASFPDPCFTPPAPSAGWIVVPYANTAFAKDTIGGSKTVFISGKPVMLKDQSHFKTSTGNEAAAGPKGVATGTKKGKAYFRSWSMDVKVEGLNVCRHSDLMTHNHNPVNGNTGAWSYLSENTKKDCKDEMEKVDKACYEEDELGDKAQQRFIKSQLRQNKKKGIKPVNRGVTPKTWKDKQCLGAMFPKGWLDKSEDDLKAEVEKLKEQITDKKETLLDDAWDMAHDKIDDMELGDLLSIDWTVVCVGGYGVGKVACKALDLYWEIQDSIGQVIDAMLKVPTFIENAKNGTLRDVVVEDMMKEVEENKCLQARKCMLVPFKPKHQKEGKSDLKSISHKNKSYNEQRSGTSLRSFLGLAHSSGCCPGQTGHHLIPGSWAKSACPNYNHDKAPVVCAEGPSQYDGTHAMIHNNLDDIAHENYGLKSKKNDTKLLTKQQTIDDAITAHQRMYPEANDCAICWGDDPCSRKCLEAQLKDAYKGCGDSFTAKLITGNRGGQDNSGR